MTRKAFAKFEILVGLEGGERHSALTLLMPTWVNQMVLTNHTDVLLQGQAKVGNLQTARSPKAWLLSEWTYC